MIQHIERHIGNLRRKPDHVKKQIAFLTSLGITLVIFGFWIGSYFVGSNSSAVAAAQVASPASSVGSTLTASVGDAWGAVSGYVGSFFAGSNSAQYKAPALVATPGNR